MAIPIIINQSKSDVTFINSESGGKDNAVISSESAQSNGAWVPWCGSTEEFEEHHITVSTFSSTYYIWEYQDRIYASQSKRWSRDAATISPYSDKGDGVLVVDDGGSIKMFRLSSKQAPPSPEGCRRLALPARLAIALQATRSRPGLRPRLFGCTRLNSGPSGRKADFAAAAGSTAAGVRISRSSRPADLTAGADDEPRNHTEREPWQGPTSR